MTYRVETAFFTLRKYVHSWTTICNHLLRGLNPISLKVFIDQVNMFHPTIKFTAENSEEEVNFLDLNIKLIDGELKTDLFVKPTDTHQSLDSTSSHPYHCKKGKML